MAWKARLLVLTLLVLAMLLTVVAPALATVNPGEHNGWVVVSTQFRPAGEITGWIVDGPLNPPGNHNGWVPCR